MEIYAYAYAYACEVKAVFVHESETEDSREKERRFLCSSPSSRGSGASSETQGQIVGARESPHYLPLGRRACFCACVLKFSCTPPSLLYCGANTFFKAT